MEAEKITKKICIDCGNNFTSLFEEYVTCIHCWLKTTFSWPIDRMRRN